MHEGPGAISTLELSAGEVKNKTELAFDIPPRVAKMLIEYRDRIAPKHHRPPPHAAVRKCRRHSKVSEGAGRADCDLFQSARRNRAHPPPVPAFERKRSCSMPRPGPSKPSGRLSGTRAIRPRLGPMPASIAVVPAGGINVWSKKPSRIKNRPGGASGARNRL